MQGLEVFGFIGGALITAGFIPQVIRVYKLKSAREISLTFTVMMLIGSVAWLTYGISLRLPSVMLWNSINIVLVALLLSAKLKYGKEAGR